MANANSTATTPEESRAEPELEYNLQPWGDLVYGTKEQLQSIGLGTGIPFPGEAGETCKKIKVVDPRGFDAKISVETWKGAGIFCASIRFPDRDRPDSEWEPVYENARSLIECARSKAPSRISQGATLGATCSTRIS